MADRCDWAIRPVTAAIASAPCKSDHSWRLVLSVRRRSSPSGGRMSAVPRTRPAQSGLRREIRLPDRSCHIERCRTLYHGTESKRSAIGPRGRRLRRDNRHRRHQSRWLVTGCSSAADGCPSRSWCLVVSALVDACRTGCLGGLNAAAGLPWPLRSSARTQWVSR